MIERLEKELRYRAQDNLINTFQITRERDDAGNCWLDLRIYADTMAQELRALGHALLAATEQESDAGEGAEVTPCPYCNGQGATATPFGNGICRYCMGTGVVKTSTPSDTGDEAIPHATREGES